MAIALLAKLRNLHTAAIQYPYIVSTLPRIIAISSHTYVSRIIRLEPALTYLSNFMRNGARKLLIYNLLSVARTGLTTISTTIWLSH